MLSIFHFFLRKKRGIDFSAQFDSSCILWEPSKKICEKHGPINFVRENFGGCIECNDKWRNIVFPQKNKS
jgi:hypothetical protein